MRVFKRSSLDVRPAPLPGTQPAAGMAQAGRARSARRAWMMMKSFESAQPSEDAEARCVGCARAKRCPGGRKGRHGPVETRFD